MEIQNVNSENISKTRYCEDNSTLEVILKTGSIFLYSEIDKKTYENFTNSYFKDSYYNKEIKNFFTCFQIK